MSQSTTKHGLAKAWTGIINLTIKRKVIIAEVFILPIFELVRAACV